VKFYSNTYCGNVEAEWAFVSEQVKIASYTVDPEFHNYYYYWNPDVPTVAIPYPYVGNAMDMLTDGQVMGETWYTNTEARFGHGVPIRSNSSTFEFTLGEAGPLQSVTIGYDVTPFNTSIWEGTVYAYWMEQSYAPATVTITCKFEDGSTGAELVATPPENPKDLHNEWVLNVGSVCADDVTSFTLHYERPEHTGFYDVVTLDEVSVFNVADFGGDSVGAALFATHKKHHAHHVKPKPRPKAHAKKAHKSKAKAEQAAAKSKPKVSNDLGRVVKLNTRK
jgi:hypothetical protein